jgi:hypothetical protein
MKKNNKKPIESEKSKFDQVKLNHIFECEGRLYAIAIPKTASGESNLSGGRSIFEFFTMD